MPSFRFRFALALPILVFQASHTTLAIEPGTEAPTELEQYALQLINRFRSAPRAELSRILPGANLSTIVRASADYTAGGTVW